jgi:hypothetical protein
MDGVKKQLRRGMGEEWGRSGFFFGDWGLGAIQDCAADIAPVGPRPTGWAAHRPRPVVIAAGGLLTCKKNWLEILTR